ncbi:MAG: hypothetical protein PHQ10_04600 [Dehalococcoidales bacterium]|jgi:predicted RNA-binding Zn-ribbon protein involved in translation (DUF1610 family)|nr:hypothetical protein [Dehalococcoidales bacterium]MDD5498683.1 hypothetical protein [Dehalococcoidales bacterium]
MAVFATYECDVCRHRVSINGPHEFYRDSAGNRKHYGHPVPVSVEAKNAGIKGFYFNFYCPVCDATKEAVIAEFKKPLDDIKCWKALKKHFIEPFCDDCGGKLYDSTAEGLKCPRCEGGHLRRDRSMHVWT